MRARDMEALVLKIPYRLSRMNCHCELPIGSLPRVCLDFPVPMSAGRLEGKLAVAIQENGVYAYASYHFSALQCLEVRT